MRHRAIKLIFGGTVFFTLCGVATAAVPNDGAQPSDKPPLYHASPMIDDPLMGTPIRGKSPAVTNTIISVPKDNLQADAPEATKPPLYRASPMINDPLGTRINSKPQ